MAEQGLIGKVFNFYGLSPAKFPAHEKSRGKINAFRNGKPCADEFQIRNYVELSGRGRKKDGKKKICTDIDVFVSLANFNSIFQRHVLPPYFPIFTSSEKLEGFLSRFGTRLFSRRHSLSLEN